MTESKKILINESFFTTSGNSNKTRKSRGTGGGRPKKEKPVAVLKPNSLKKTLLEKIKKHQQHEKISKQMTDTTSRPENESSKFTDDFMNSMEYLSKLSEKNKKSNRSSN